MLPTNSSRAPDKTKDAEAEQLIGNEIGSQQNAIYKLTQAVLVQEMALKEMKQKNEYLEQCVEHHKSESNRGAFSKMMGGNKPAPQPPSLHISQVHLVVLCKQQQALLSAWSPAT